jgi:protein-S-isoprenylcysteine O-methyltransferase Ste14
MVETFSERGGGWVIAQSVLFLAVLVIGVVFRGQFHQPALFAIGVVLFSGAAAAGILGLKDLGRSRTPFPKPVEGTRLVQHGIFALVRHPLYTSVILWAFGWSLLWQSWAALGGAVATALFLNAKAVREEEFLRKEFPEYADYARRVRRFIPGIY